MTRPGLATARLVRRNADGSGRYAVRVAAVTMTRDASSALAAVGAVFPDRYVVALDGAGDPGPRAWHPFAVLLPDAAVAIGAVGSHGAAAAFGAARTGLTGAIGSAFAPLEVTRA